MLRLLLDQHISPDVIIAARRLESSIALEHVLEREWQALPDAQLLRLARADDLTLLARALVRLWSREKTADWLNRTYYLTRF